jgi:2,3-bisphosphoglycerate-dependent phosphoglycerate mutase
MSQGMEHDTTVLHAARAKMRRDLLVDGPFTELILVRHAQQSFTDADLESGGAAGPRLSETGELQARLTGEHLAVEHIAGLYSSSLTRARNTARGIADPAVLPLSPVIRNDLREIESRGSQTEPSDKVRARLTAELTGIVNDHPGQVVAAVSHGGAISAFLASILGIEPDIFFFAAHASVTRVRFSDGRWAVQSVNETDHLRQHKLVTY